MKKILILMIVCCFSFSSWGQQKNVPGTIVSENGSPIKNIRLFVMNSSSSAKSNKNGKFILRKVLPNDSIIVNVNNKSYFKFPLGDNDSLKMILSDQMISVNQGSPSGISSPVLLGTYYHDFDRNASVITADMIKRMDAKTMLDIITLLIPGVTYNPETNGIIIRGAKSIIGSNDALFIIDGSFTDLGTASGIPVETIETIEIVKDGVGYGSRGANGVIIINTKK